MSKTIQILLEMSTLLKNSPRIAVFCTDNGLNPVTVEFPANEQSPIGEADAPWIVLDPESGSGGLGATETESVIGLYVGVVGDPEAGTVLLDEFFTLVLDVLVKAGLDIDQVECEFVLSDSAPLRMVFSSIGISKSRSLGRDNII
ncbi:hypothetical protein [Maridesulfovibrio ferrireducens]|uniref:hypothetical protein n=1 Tax=Maridesulfovibrio ferrireducens TaxID=246191 RepID=UPI001A1FCDF8|nr:hypothetical protein [Maridesulfovibrio ferrireducens]MBI9110002.1 hypothetical protein [Maridesulfovibrio ferrireducens]